MLISIIQRGQIIDGRSHLPDCLCNLLTVGRLAGIYMAPMRSASIGRLTTILTTILIPRHDALTCPMFPDVQAQLSLPPCSRQTMLNTTIFQLILAQLGQPSGWVMGMSVTTDHLSKQLLQFRKSQLGQRHISYIWTQFLNQSRFRGRDTGRIRFIPLIWWWIRALRPTREQRSSTMTKLLYWDYQAPSLSKNRNQWMLGMVSGRM